jgi:hypothetical protein
MNINKSKHNMREPGNDECRKTKWDPYRRSYSLSRICLGFDSKWRRECPRDPTNGFIGTHRVISGLFHSTMSPWCLDTNRSPSIHIHIKRSLLIHLHIHIKRSKLIINIVFDIFHTRDMVICEIIKKEPFKCTG